MNVSISSMKYFKQFKVVSCKFICWLTMIYLTKNCHGKNVKRLTKIAYNYVYVFIFYHVFLCFCMLCLEIYIFSARYRVKIAFYCFVASNIIINAIYIPIICLLMLKKLWSMSSVCYDQIIKRLRNVIFSTVSVVPKCHDTIFLQYRNYWRLIGVNLQLETCKNWHLITRDLK